MKTESANILSRGPAVLRTARRLIRGWRHMLPAVVILGCLSCLWGATALGLGYWARVASLLDESFPLIASCRDGVTMEQARELAQRLATRSEVHSARAIEAGETLGNLLPVDRDWAKEIQSSEAKGIPPALRVVVDGGVLGRNARSRVRSAMESEATVEFVWPDGPDLDGASAKLNEARRFLARASWLAFMALLAVWLAFLALDFPRFAVLFRDEEAPPSIGEGVVYARPPVWTRGVVVALLSGLAATFALILATILLCSMTPLWAFGAAWLRAMAFAAIAGVGGHGAVAAFGLARLGRRPRLSFRA